MEMTVAIGILLGIGGIVLGNVIEGGHITSLVQGAAAIIVFCGTFGAVLVSSRVRDLKLGLRLARAVFMPEKSRGENLLKQMVDCSRIARKESILAIEPKVAAFKDPFSQSVVQSVVDGVDPVVIRSIYDKQIELYEDELLAGAKVWLDAGGYAPTIGIIGAVLGLIHVMGNLTDTSKLGAGIAVAFVATIYGVGSANLIFLPIGNRIKKYVHEQIKIREMILEGGLSILSGLSPHVIEMKLSSFLQEVKK